MPNATPLVSVSYLTKMHNHTALPALRTHSQLHPGTQGPQPHPADFLDIPMEWSGRLAISAALDSDQRGLIGPLHSAHTSVCCGVIGTLPHVHGHMAYILRFLPLSDHRCLLSNV